VKLATDSDRTRWIAFMQAQPLPLDVECKKWRKSRTNEQNALLWAMYAPIAEHMGYDADAIHEWMCGRMWGWKDIKVPKTPRNPEGLASVPMRSTTRDENGKRNVIDKATFTCFVDMVDRIAAQAGVFIPMERAA
jgi:hypothetical protein